MLEIYSVTSSNIIKEDIFVHSVAICGDWTDTTYTYGNYFCCCVTVVKINMTKCFKIGWRNKSYLRSFSLNNMWFGSTATKISKNDFLVILKLNWLCVCSLVQLDTNLWQWTVLSPVLSGLEKRSCCFQLSKVITLCHLKPQWLADWFSSYESMRSYSSILGRRCFKELFSSKLKFCHYLLSLMWLESLVTFVHSPNTQSRQKMMNGLKGAYWSQCHHMRNRYFAYKYYFKLLFPCREKYFSGSQFLPGIHTCLIKLWHSRCCASLNKFLVSLETKT